MATAAPVVPENKEKPMLAFHGSPDIKTSKLTQLRAHEAADQIIKGRYWEHGKGCAVGCTIHGSNHAAYETELGIPQMLAHLEDRIFEGMSNKAAMRFPARFIEAIPVGADLALVGWKFLRWMVGDVLEKHGTDAVRSGCAAALAVLEMKATNLPVTADADARSAARSAADAADAYAADAYARSAARSAADAARSAADAADAYAAYARSAAAYAAYAAYARSAAYAARSAARSAAYAAYARSAAAYAAYARSAAAYAAAAARSAAARSAAAYAAAAARSAAARSAAAYAAAAFDRQAEKLLELLAEAPLPEGLLAA